MHVMCIAFENELVRVNIIQSCTMSDIFTESMINCSRGIYDASDLEHGVLHDHHPAMCVPANDCVLVCDSDASELDMCTVYGCNMPDTSVTICGNGSALVGVGIDFDEDKYCQLGVPDATVLYDLLNAKILELMVDYKSCGTQGVCPSGASREDVRGYIGILRGKRQCLENVGYLFYSPCEK